VSDNGKSSSGFEPEITAFMCNYCAYMSADTAGTQRIQYPANVKLVRLPCTGKTDIRYILKAFEEGADGAYIIACPIGNCHHVAGERARAAPRPKSQADSQERRAGRRPAGHVLHERWARAGFCGQSFRDDGACASLGAESAEEMTTSQDE